MKKTTILALVLLIINILSVKAEKQSTPFNISGIYPQLAYYNNEGECGTGAVVPWAGNLWVVTYGPHNPFGSSDKLYQITPDLKQIIRKESVGGTPADRMIHKETNQLFIGPYAIDSVGNVKTIDIKLAPGRYTGIARHLKDPSNKVYIATMEAGVYEIDVKTLVSKVLYPDGNTLRKEGQAAQFSPLLPGCHGKGFYSGQGVTVFSNNGEDSKDALTKPNIQSGSLNEWDGKDWKLVRRNQFTEVTGPGGIYGNKNPETDPIWTNGWDYKSVVVGVRDNGGWTFYRLPKASRSYDGAHGWNTEWPRIRDIGTTEKPDYMMTMHGMFWNFPATFSSTNSAGIRPRSAYLKVVGDFTRWNDGLVMGCDDAAKSEFLNSRKEKGGIAAPGQSNSNLWFMSLKQPDLFGPTTASGSVWLDEEIKAGVPSEPFLFSGWSYRGAWLKNAGDQSVVFNLEADVKGNNKWSALKKVTVSAHSSVFLPFNEKESGEWVRVSSDKETKASVSFTYSSHDNRKTTSDAIFTGLTKLNSKTSMGGLLYSLGENRRALGILANSTVNGKTIPIGFYQMNDKMNIVVTADPKMEAFMKEKVAIPKNVITIEKGSVLITDNLKRRWRLPLGDEKYKELLNKNSLRICREVSTERDAFSCMGTFYELPAENADGFAKIRPISTHNFCINDYCSYRGMLILTGVSPELANGNAHILVSKDQKVAVWAGAFDDLWKLGKPVGKGGPWVNSDVKKSVPSDPFLIGFYDKRSVQLSHNSAQPITFTIEVDPTGDGDWMKYNEIEVNAGEKKNFEFPNEFQARWIRFISSADAQATAWLEYK